MTSKTQIILLELFSVVFASGRLISTNVFSNEITSASLPANEAQKRYVAESVCTENEGYYDDSEDSINKCIEDFGWDMGMGIMDEAMSGLGVSCWWPNEEGPGVTLEVPSSRSYQLLLLVPSPNDGIPRSALFNFVAPNSKYSDEIVLEPDTNYSTYITEVRNNVTPTVWHQGATVLYRTIPLRKNYDVQINFEANEDLVDVEFTWNRTSEFDVCFELEMACEGRYPMYKIFPESALRVKFDNLTQKESCDAKLRGLYGTTDIQFYTPVTSQLPRKVQTNDILSLTLADETQSSEALNKNIPNITQETDSDPNVNNKFTWVKQVMLMAVEEGDKWVVYVRWHESLPRPERYNVTLRADTVMSTVVPGNTTETEFRDVTGTDYYNVSVYAIKGHMSAHNFASAAFLRRAPVAAPAGGAGAGVLRWALAAAAAWAAAALAGLLYWLRAHRDNFVPRVAAKMLVDSKPSDTACIEPECAEPPPSPPTPDAWEIAPGRLALHEVIGEGAFGVVRRGTLAPLHKEVAVKMLKDFPSMDEMRAFYVEMELMKSVGAHPHVVSLVGCCSTRQPAIVAEYCSRGDLLNFLRCSWDVMISKRNADYCNNNVNYTLDYRNDIFKMPQENSRLVINKLYDLQGVCDTELTSLDLLSFCRQIAMGMEFLALNKVVHRDLAARNVLVTGDRTLKIADFGLSRDVYEDNEYKQKGNGKMPIKWMALESLTRRIYTTQSDVWSFGVVVWEVVTLGGAPYAGVAPARLPRLLRAGYRMPRPPNCSSQLYELMRCCWVARPRDRPTFAELHARLDELLNSASADEYLTLELDEEPQPQSPYEYFKLILSSKRSWTRGQTYERPLKANHNHYTTPPVNYKTPGYPGYSRRIDFTDD